MKINSTYSLLLPLFLGFVSILSNFNDQHHSSLHNCVCEKDTSKAVVAYGSDYLFETAVDFSTLNIQERLDSLIAVDSITPGIQREIDFYKTVSRKTEEEIFLMIDSMFNLDSIPFALINQINLFTAMMPEQIALPDLISFIKEDGTPYPANVYYHEWNTRGTWHYPDSLHRNDSIVVLQLANPDEDMYYNHPLCQKTLRRYYGWVTSPFGWRDGKSHNGVDLELHLYDSILNMFDGKVRVASKQGGFGKVVIVRHFNGLETLYAHMSQFKVRAGDTVKAGQVLGLGGMTGNATGTHLHLEIRFKGLPINPAHIISFADKELYSDTLILKKYKHRYIAYPYGKEFHIVKRGESPYRIAKRYGMELATLRALNGYTPKTRLIVGQKVRVIPKSN